MLGGNGAMDYIFKKFASKGVCQFLWEDAFPSFARAFSILGSPIQVPTLIGLMDGTFMGVGRPGGMCNYHHSRFTESTSVYSTAARKT